jgi:ferredoxin
MTITVQFLPDNITTIAAPGEGLLDVADRAGVHIPTGCLMGSCHACAVEVNGEEVCGCITAIPADCAAVTVQLFHDPTW